MENNRPEGRKKRIGGEGSGLHRRGDGLNTGPVGSGEGFKPASGTPGPGFTGNGGGGNYNGRRSGGGKSPLVIIVLLLALLFGGKGALSSFLGGGEIAEVPPTPAAVQLTPRPTPKPSPKPNAGISGAALQGILGAGSQSDWKEPANTSAAVNQTVASGAREKFTTIRGKGKDVVTLMVYMCGTDLESRGGMATKDLLEMTRATISDKVNLIVYTGGCTHWNNNVVSKSSNQIYQVVSGNLKSLNGNAGTGSMTDPKTLADFISYSAKKFPADRYQLIFWDHGGGSVSGFGYDQRYGSNSSMTLSGIKQALEKGGVKFDFIGFDACLMGTLENGLMLADHADYLIASEETEPGTGWYYTTWLTKLSANSSTPTTEIGRQIVDDFITACAQGAPGQAATLSVVDLAELSATVPPAFKAFSESISGMIAAKEYAQVSQARSNTREFARSTAIDQIDLVHFAGNIGNAEAKALSRVLLDAVKYNRTSSNMNNAYGVSIYFPYRKLSNVDKAVKTYSAIGLDDSYSQCIREFASLETSGQVSTGGYSNPYASLFGDLSQYGLSGSAGSYGYGYGGYGSSSGAGGYGSSSGAGGYGSSSGASGYGSSSGGYSSSDSMELINSLISAFLGGDMGSMSGLGGSTDYLFGRSMPQEDAAAYIAENLFDPSALVWTENAAGERVIALSEEQWSLVRELDLNMFVLDGDAYLDLGRDNIFDWDDSGDLLAPQELTWLTINGHFIAYYHEYSTGSGADRVDTGYCPVLLNGERAELLISFDSEGCGSVVGVRSVYAGETDTVAKSLTEPGPSVDFRRPDAAETDTTAYVLKNGDRVDFLCDCYGTDGTYRDSYMLGDPLIVDGELKVYDAYLPAGRTLMTYRFTDLYQQHYWTLPIEG